MEQTLNPDKIELVLSGGEIVTTTGVVKADLAIADGRIAAVMEPGLPIGGARTWDISGLTVLPGAIDTHAHLRDPGFTHKEDITTGTMAAALGGYTTVVGMPNVKPPTTTAERYQEILDLYDQRSLVDFNHNPSPTSLSEVEDMAEAGALGFKVFMIEDSGRDYPHMPGVGVHDHGELLKVCEAVAATGRPLMVHPHNQEIMSVIEERTWQRGEFDFRAYARAFLEYDGIVWDSAVSLLIRLHEATGVRMHILHLRTPRTVDLVRDAKARGLAVTAEMNSAPLFLTSDWANIEKYGPYALSTWCGPDSHEALWGALLDGTADVIGTDHAPHTREEKELGWSNMWKAHGGVPQIQHSLPLLLDAVASGKITLERVVEVTSLAPARIFGLYPKKGEIRVGADADLAIVDLRKEWVIDDSQVASKCGWTPYHGWKVRGKVVHTLVRGVPVVENGEVVGRPGLGKLAAPVS